MPGGFVDPMGLSSLTWNPLFLLGHVNPLPSSHHQGFLLPLEPLQLTPGISFLSEVQSLIYYALLLGL